MGLNTFTTMQEPNTIKYTTWKKQLLGKRSLGSCSQKVLADLIEKDTDGTDEWKEKLVVAHFKKRPEYITALPAHQRPPADDHVNPTPIIKQAVAPPKKEEIATKKELPNYVKTAQKNGWRLLEGDELTNTNVLPPKIKAQLKPKIEKILPLGEFHHWINCKDRLTLDRMDDFMSGWVDGLWRLSLIPVVYYTMRLFF